MERYIRNLCRFSSLLVAHNLVKSYGKDGIAAGTVSVASFFAVGGLEGMGATGLFIALIIALISGELFQRLSGNPKLVIKMPDGVPPAVAKSFAALLPAMITISLFSLITSILFALELTISLFHSMKQFNNHLWDLQTATHQHYC